MKLTDLKIGTRLALGFALVLALLLAIVSISFLRMMNTGDELEATLTLQHRASLANQWLTRSQMNISRTVAIAKSASQPEVESYFVPLMKVTTAEISETQKQLESGGTETNKALMATIAEKRAAYMAARAQMFELLKAGDHAGSEAMLKDKVLPLTDTYLVSLGELQKYEEGSAKARSAQLGETLKKTLVMLIGLLAASLVVGVAMAVVITRSVVRPLQEAVAAASAIAGNDLSQPLNSLRRDELGDLLRTLGRMQDSLRHMVGQVRLSSDSISSASTEIASGNKDLSERTEQTASNLQQAATSMEHLTGTVKHSADSARQANQLASSAAEVAARGGDVVSKVVSTMNEINTSSKKIADIIGVIDGIAFQTNILALNAAVEAARAGEQGRGFAVVAGEVRNLAQRSAQAAKEIKGLIGASVDKVESGSKLVADAGKTMQEIVGSVQRVTDIIGEITAAASEQSDGIGQVNTSVVQLDQMTQQNAALVEQSASAAESLKEQAARLAKVVGAFRIDANSSASAPTPTPAAHAAPAANKVSGPKAPPAATAPARKSAPPARSDADWESF